MTSEVPSVTSEVPSVTSEVPSVTFEALQGDTSVALGDVEPHAEPSDYRGSSSHTPFDGFRTDGISEKILKAKFWDSKRLSIAPNRKCLVR